MKTTMIAVLLGVLGAATHAQSTEQSYAVLAYGAPTGELIFVYSAADFVCNTQILANLSEIQQQLVAPSLTQIGSGCLMRDRLSSLNPPLCTVLESRTDAVPSMWEYGCYRGIAERILAPTPTASELANRRGANEAAKVAERQAAELAAKRVAERMAWQRYAVAWAYQREKVSCLRALNAHRAPGQDDPEPLCDRHARNDTAGNPAQDVIDYCAYIRSAGQPENAINAACDTTADAPFNVMPPTVMSLGR